jgi:hypothetical protein
VKCQSRDDQYDGTLRDAFTTQQFHPTKFSTGGCWQNYPRAYGVLGRRPSYSGTAAPMSGCRLIPPALARDLPAHLQCTAEQRLHEAPRRVVPIRRCDGSDQEQHADPGEQKGLRHSVRGLGWGGFAQTKRRSSSRRPASTHDGSIAIGVTLKTVTPLRNRFGDRRERGMGLFDRPTVVVDNAPAPVRVTGGPHGKHVHLDDLTPTTNRVREMWLGQARCQRVRRLLRLSKARWKHFHNDT